MLMMDDFAMCQDSTCPRRKDCYRYMKKPNSDGQNYSMFYRNPTKDECGYFEEVAVWDELREDAK